MTIPLLCLVFLIVVLLFLAKASKKSTLKGQGTQYITAIKNDNKKNFHNASPELLADIDAFFKRKHGKFFIHAEPVWGLRGSMRYAHKINVLVTLCFSDGVPFTTHEVYYPRANNKQK